MLMERYGEALADLDRAIELDPGHAWAIANRGYTYRRMERYEEALADLSRAIELDPGHAWAIASRGETYVNAPQQDPVAKLPNHEPRLTQRRLQRCEQRTGHPRNA